VSRIRKHAYRAAKQAFDFGDRDAMFGAFGSISEIPIKAGNFHRRPLAK
jgi:hypothetical protein